MSEIKNGGPAFPVSTRQCETPGEYGHQDSNSTWQFGGMSMRDYFAAKAMQGYLASISPDAEPVEFATRIAEDAYILADAMLAAREVKS